MRVVVDYLSLSLPLSPSLSRSLTLSLSLALFLSRALSLSFEAPRIANARCMPCRGLIERVGSNRHGLRELYIDC